MGTWGSSPLEVTASPEHGGEELTAEDGDTGEGRPQ